MHLLTGTVRARPVKRHRTLCSCPQNKSKAMAKRFPGSPGQNLLLQGLSEADQALILPHLELVTLERDTFLERADEPPKYAYFILDGVASVMAFKKDGRKIEAGLFGYEGMSGIAAVTGGVTSPTDIFMQIAGSALRIEISKLAELQRVSWDLHAHLLLYLHSILIQVSHTALSNRRDTLEERLARWLLMCHDRVQGDKVPLTHEFLSLMLGSRRAGVTVGTHLLEGKGLIRALRGNITILDRKGLDVEADGSYGPSEDEYNRLFANARTTARS